MRNKRIYTMTAGLLGAVLAASAFAPTTVLAEGTMGWREEDGEKYWYENDVKQGLEGRGKEIYDPESDAWYWLDSVDGGRMAKSKDVYQESWAGQYADREDGTGKWVRYDANGHMVKGWNTNDAGTYYFDLVTGAMAKGFTEIDGKPCAFDWGTGIGVNCQWAEIDGNQYWYEGGVRQGLEGRGKEIYDPASDAWYWLDSVDGGKKAVSKDVYQESSGGKWVRYDANGHMIKGWNEQNGNRYYFDPVTGAMAKGVVKVDGKKYSFNENTGICEGEYTKTASIEWHQEKEERYNKDGVLVEIDSYTYNADGTKATRIWWRNGSGNIDEAHSDTWKYEYDDAKHLIDKTRYDKNGVKMEVTKYTYEGDKCVREDYYGYDHEGKEVQDGYSTYEYDSNGNKIKRLWYASGDRLCLSYTYEYDAAGNMTKEIYYYDEAMKNVCGWIKYTYEEINGKYELKTKEKYDADGTCFSINSWEHDAYGRVTKYTDCINNEIRGYEVYEYSAFPEDAAVGDVYEGKGTCYGKDGKVSARLVNTYKAYESVE